MEYLNEEGLAALWDDTKEYVEKYHGENSGEQESDGTEAGPISELTAKGHAEQATTLGKNLARPNYDSSKNGTFNGIIWTYVSDGIWHVSGTATDVSRLALGSQAYITHQLPVGTYTVSLWRADGESSGLYTRFGRDSDNAYVGETGNQATFTLSESFAIRADLRVLSGVTIDTDISLQLELGSTATSYEPYTGGAPSPSPDYPQEIQVVRGRNLLDLSNRTVRPTTNSDPTSQKTMDGTGLWVSMAADGYVRDRCTYSLSGSTLQVSTGAVGYGVGFETVLDEGHEYVTSCKVESGGVRMYAAFFNANGVAMSFEYAETNRLVFTVPSGCACTVIGIGASTSNASVTVSQVQLERGSVVHSYVPYGDYVGLEAHGKNLLPNNVVPRTLNGLTITLNADKSVTINGTATTGTWIVVAAGVTVGSQCFMSGCPAGGSLSTYSLQTGGNDGTWRDNGDGVAVPVGTYDISIVVRQDIVCNNLTFYPQLELGSVTTSYEPYFHSITPIPLPSRGWAAGLPDGTTDTLTLDGAGKVVWERKTNEVEWDGSNDETWGVATNSSSGLNYAYIPSPDDTPPSKSRGYSNIYCSRYMYADGLTQDGGIMLNATGMSTSRYTALIDNAHATSESWRTWLSTHPVTVLYPLATPVTEQRGYVDLPDIPEGVSISIPELDDLGVKYHVDGAASTLAHQWYERARSEYEDRIAALEEAVAEIIAG